MFVRIARGPDAGLLQAILRDTTERRLLDARIHEAQKWESLGRMAGGRGVEVAPFLSIGATGEAVGAQTTHGCAVAKSPSASKLRGRSRADGSIRPRS